MHDSRWRVRVPILIGLLLAACDAPCLGAEIATRSSAAGATAAQVQTINQWVRRGWTDSQLAPSAAAEDGEFCRRCYLDLLGRIPKIPELRQYETDRRPDKRRRLIRRLLEEGAYRDEYARHWAWLWTNLLIGREGDDDRNRVVNRDGMYRFLHDAFTYNKPYDRLAYELVSATGSNRPGAEGFNGAVNFLAGKLGDGATQATAQTARLFLGLQVQCTQCHNHPFNDWKQSQFWQLNSFFRQTVVLRRFQAGTREVRYVDLANQDFAGEDRPSEPDHARVYYELRNGELKAAYPVFVDGTAIGRSGFVDDVNRRDELARLISRSEYLPRAIVNRLWAHFLGYGFTRPIDDMGPHNPPVLAELLDYLAQQLQQNECDLRQLIQWIMLSEPYGLSSRFHRRNEADDPTRGHPPQFSRFYLRQMSAEQLYSSLRIASQADELQSDAEQQERARRKWLRQFTIALGTDEGDEATTFNGTITQTLMMFNGELTKQATGIQEGSYLIRVAGDARRRPIEKIRELFQAALSRRPTRRELQMAQQLLTGHPQGEQEALQDLWWALLNSNEFILIH